MIKVFESFAGIGTQSMALKRLKEDYGLEYEVVGISEVDEYAIKSYDAIHTNDDTTFEASEKEMKGYLEKLNIPLMKNGKRKSLKGKVLKDFYNASKRVKNYGDISKINTKDLPEIDLFTYSFPCFTGDSLVLTQKGYKEIKDVKVGDFVITHDNTYKKVINTYNNGEKKIKLVKGMSIDEIRTTENHKFYVRKRKRVWDNANRTYLRVFETPEWLEVKNLNKDYYMGIAINQKSELPKWEGIKWDRKTKNGVVTSHRNIIKPLLNDNRFWYFVGRYVANGWVRTQGGAILGIGKDKLKTFEDKIGNFINYTVVEERTLFKERTVFKVHFPCKELQKFLEPIGRGAANKEIPDYALNLPINLLESFLEGYFDGDGFIDKYGYHKCSSVNRKLIYGLGQCIAKVYRRPYSIYKNKTKPTCIIEGRVVNQKNYYSLTFKKETKSQDNAFFENGYIWFPINSISDGDVETVYDIEVEDNHSFTVQNTIVHNCQSISTAGKQEGLTKNSGTTSSLAWESLRIIKDTKPKMLLMENVRNLVSKKFIKDFELIIKELEGIGYKNYWKILNARDYGIPQNRERVFMVSLLDDRKFDFPEGFELDKRLKDILEYNVEEKYYLTNDKADILVDKLLQKYDLEDISFADSTINKPRMRDVSNVITARYDAGIQNVQSIGLVVVERLLGLYDKENSTHQSTSVYNVNGTSPTLSTCSGGGSSTPRINK